MSIMRTVVLALAGYIMTANAAEKPIKLFILAGDELVLEQGIIDGRTDGVHDAFFPHAETTAGEEAKHATAAVYHGAYSATADYDALTPIATALVELGEQRTRQIRAGHRGREPIPMTPFPAAAFEAGHTTVVRGWVDVPYDGHYEFLAGAGESAFNITVVNGVEAYRFEPGMAEARIIPIRLATGTRHAFRTIFIKRPGHAFALPMIDKPGTLETIVRNNPAYAFLRNQDGAWATRDDVVLFDAHPIHNNTETAGSFLSVGDVAYGGRSPRGMIGVEQMLGHTLGDHFDPPVMLLRFGTHHPTHFRRGSRALAHDYMPPSSGGGGGENMKWDIIHFNWGIWDIAYRDPKPNDRWHSCVINGTITTTIEQYEENLRELVARMKATGATLIWGSITPTHPDTPGRKPEDPGRYNAVAAAIMEANGVRINDLYSESIRQGYPKRPDVHSTGNLASKAIEAIEAALADLENPSTPLPRILLIGDSITGSYQAAVSKHFEGRAEIYKNPGNAEHTGTGLRMIDRWLDTKAYSFSGQEYMELLNSIRKTLDDMERYYPDYNGRPVALAGLFWFQGISDASTPAMAAEYATHLPNLIRDLRRDLKAPELPAVITAIGWDGRHADIVRDAQLAIGETIPRAAAIDTRPFLRAADVSPGNRADMYFQNAETFLDIGKAMAEGMLKMQAVSE
ncbi:MAG: sialate O-acetylesterase [Kiritimatiellia bacterium]